MYFITLPLEYSLYSLYYECALNDTVSLKTSSRKNPVGQKPDKREKEYKAQISWALPFMDALIASLKTLSRKNPMGQKPDKREKECNA